MATGWLHGMVPKGVDRRPGKKVAMVLAGKADNLLFDGQFFAKEHAPAPVLHQQHPDQQHDHRGLGAPYGDVLGQPVVPHVGLDKVQADKEGVGGQSGDVESVQAGRVPAAISLGIVDQSPDAELVQQVEAPGRGLAPEGWLRQLPIVP